MPHSRHLGVAAVDRNICDECGLCMPLCPTLAIEMHRDGLSIVEPRCTGCRKCIAPCPVHALRMVDLPLTEVPPLVA